MFKKKEIMKIAIIKSIWSIGLIHLRIKIKSSQKTIAYIINTTYKLSIGRSPRQKAVIVWYYYLKFESGDKSLLKRFRKERDSGMLKNIVFLR